MTGITRQEVADRLEPVKACDRLTLRLLARLPLIHTSALARVRGWTGDQAMYDSLARLRQVDFVRSPRLPISPTASGQMHHLTDLGIAAVALDRQLDAVDLAQALGLDAGTLRSTVPHARLLHATYELLAALVIAAGSDVELRCWQRPWRTWYRGSGGATRHLVLPALAGLAWGDATSEYLLLPDISAFPLRVYRGAIWALHQVRARHHGQFPRLIVATTGSARAARWRELALNITERRGEASLELVSGSWGELPGLLDESVAREQARPAGGIGIRPRVHALRGPDLNRPIPKLVGNWPAPSSRTNSSVPAPVDRFMLVPSDLALLTLIGQHPFLKVADVAALLGWKRGRTGWRCSRLTRAGLLEELGADEVGSRSIERHLELTRAGLDRVAAWQGVPRGAVVQSRVLAGGGASSRNPARRSLLRTFEHTQGVYRFFVDLAVLAARFRALGWDDELVEWQSIPAVTWPRPDACGSYRHNGQLYGFVLEYDRGTEKAQHYLRKFGGYFAYCDSRRFEQDFDGFPTILMVAPDETAECRIAGAACSAARGRSGPLPLLLTYRQRIDGDRNGLLGPIWREPHAGFDERRPWPMPQGGGSR